MKILYIIALICVFIGRVLNSAGGMLLNEAVAVYETNPMRMRYPLKVAIAETIGILASRGQNPPAGYIGVNDIINILGVANHETVNEGKTDIERVLYLAEAMEKTGMIWEWRQHDGCFVIYPSPLGQEENTIVSNVVGHLYCAIREDAGSRHAVVRWLPLEPIRNIQLFLGGEEKDVPLDLADDGWTRIAALPASGDIDVTLRWEEGSSERREVILTEASPWKRLFSREYSASASIKDWWGGDADQTSGIWPIGFLLVQGYIGIHSDMYWSSSRGTINIGVSHDGGVPRNWFTLVKDDTSTEYRMEPSNNRHIRLLLSWPREWKVVQMKTRIRGKTIEVTTLQ